jgi:hypothetical protein
MATSKKAQHLRQQLMASDEIIYKVTRRYDHTSVLNSDPNEIANALNGIARVSALSVHWYNSWETELNVNGYLSPESIAKYEMLEEVRKQLWSKPNE